MLFQVMLRDVLLRQNNNIWFVIISVLDIPAPMLNTERSVKAQFYCPCAVYNGLSEK